MAIKYKGILASSSDPTGQTLSTTVQGVIIGASSLIVFFGTQVFHVQISAADVSTLAEEVGAVISAIVIVYGLIRKIVNSVGTVSTVPSSLPGTPSA